MWATGTKLVWLLDRSITQFQLPIRRVHLDSATTDQLMIMLARTPINHHHCQKKFHILNQLMENNFWYKEEALDPFSVTSNGVNILHLGRKFVHSTALAKIEPIVSNISKISMILTKVTTRSLLSLALQLQTPIFHSPISTSPRVPKPSSFTLKASPCTLTPNLRSIIAQKTLVSMKKMPIPKRSKTKWPRLLIHSKREPMTPLPEPSRRKSHNSTTSL